MKKEIVPEDTYESNVQVIAFNIKNLSQDVRKILNSGLTEEAIIVLLVHSTGLTKTAVKDVLSALIKLDKRYVK